MNPSPRETKPNLYLTRRYEFSASHRLYNPAFPDEKNWEVFRECNNPNGHGHNYELEVTIQGSPDPRTGMLLDLGALDELVQERLIRHVDHKHLNLDVPFLQEVIPTAENIVYMFWRELSPAVPKTVRLHRLRLLESKNNVAEYQGEPV